MKGLYVFLGVVAVIGTASFLIYIKVKKKIQAFSREVFGTESIIQGLSQAQEEYDNIPYSISSGNSMTIRNITKDFPDMHVSVLEGMVKKFLTSYFNSLESLKESEEIKKMSTGTVMESIRSEIKDLKDSGKRRRIDNIKFHGIAISGYKKTLEYATAYYQVALEYTENKRYNVNMRFIVPIFSDLDIETLQFAVVIAVVPWIRPV